MDSTYITQASSNPYAATITIPGSISDGYHDLTITAYDAKGRTGSSSVSIFIGDEVNITLPAGGASIARGTPTTIAAEHIGLSTVTSATAYITNPWGGSDPNLDMTSDGSGTYSVLWTPTAFGVYRITVRLQFDDGSDIYSDEITITST